MGYRIDPHASKMVHRKPAFGLISSEREDSQQGEAKKKLEQ